MFLSKILNTLYPVGYCCLNCSKEIFDDETLLCDNCKKILPYITGKRCLHCCEPITGSGNYCLHCKGKKFYCDKIISPFVYDSIAKKFVIELKYDNRKYISQCLAKYMYYSFIKENLPYNLVTCVPLCNKRFKERGYNQSELLGNYFAQDLNCPFYANLLERVKETPTQTKLTFTERQKNMSGAFKVKDKQLIKDKIVIIVDDVYTTGATIKECALVLKKAGAKAVYAVTACHTIFKNEQLETKKL